MRFWIEQNRKRRNTRFGHNLRRNAALENTIRDGGSTTLYAAHTIDMVNTVDMVDTLDTVYAIQTALHLLNSSWAGGTDVADRGGDRTDVAETHYSIMTAWVISN